MCLSVWSEGRVCVCPCGLKAECVCVHARGVNTSIEMGTRREEMLDGFTRGREGEREREREAERERENQTERVQGEAIGPGKAWLM